MIQTPELTGVMMSNLCWLTDEQMARLRPFFPKSHGKLRVDDRRVLSGILVISRNGLRWCDAPREYGPPKTLGNRCKRWVVPPPHIHMIVPDGGLSPDGTRWPRTTSTLSETRRDRCGCSRGHLRRRTPADHAPCRDET